MLHPRAVGGTASFLKYSLYSFILKFRFLIRQDFLAELLKDEKERYVMYVKIQKGKWKKDEIKMQERYKNVVELWLLESEGEIYQKNWRKNK